MTETAPELLPPAPRGLPAISGGQPTAIVPSNLDDAFRMAQLVSQSELAPYGMNKPQQILVAIMTGLEIGVKPMQAIQGIAVINKRPCIWGDLALAICRGSGELEYIKETFEGEEPEDWGVALPSKADRKFKAVCRVKRKGEPETVSEFSIGDAVTAKLWHKKGHSGQDTPWVTNPKRMLKMRARGFGLRDQFTDVLKGLYIAEELQGTDDLDNRPAIAPAPPAEVREAISAPATAQAPVQQRGPQAPPAPEAEEAEFTETTSDKPLQERPAPAGEPDKPQEPAKAAGAPAPETKPANETFNVTAFLEEVETVFASCRTSSDVDEAHEGFGDRVKGYLSRPQRERYGDLHADALERVSKGSGAPAETTAAPPPDDDDDDAPAAEPSPADVYAGKLRAALQNCTSAAEPGEIWNASRDERKRMEQSGEMTTEFRKKLHNEVLDVYHRLVAEQGRPEPAAEKPAPTTTKDEPAGGGEQDTELAKFVDEFRARIEAVPDINALNALITETQEKRDALKAKHGPAADAFKVMITAARKRLAGLG